MKTAIIFGITGQDGSHLADFLLEKHYKVIGIKRTPSSKNNQRIQHLLDNPNFILEYADVTDTHSLTSIFRNNAQVDEVYNLAAQSHVGTSFQQPGLTWDVTAKGCLNILQTIIDLNILNTRFYQASSSEMFGNSYTLSRDGHKYQDENTKFSPQSPYAIAKCAAHYSVQFFRESYGLHASSGILFNHEGPRRGDNFVTKKIINWVVDFYLWMKNNSFKVEYLCYTDKLIHGLYDKVFPKLRLGNINISKDWGYAVDYVESMWLMLQQNKPEDYIICTGKSYSLNEFIYKSFKKLGFDSYSNFIYIDEELYRPIKSEYILGDNSKAIKNLNWKPKYNLDMLISLMIDSELNDKLSNNARHI